MVRNTAPGITLITIILFNHNQLSRLQDSFDESRLCHGYFIVRPFEVNSEVLSEVGVLGQFKSFLLETLDSSNPFSLRRWIKSSTICMFEAIIPQSSTRMKSSISGLIKRQTSCSLLANPSSNRASTSLSYHNLGATDSPYRLFSSRRHVGTVLVDLKPGGM